VNWPERIPQRRRWRRRRRHLNLRFHYANPIRIRRLRDIMVFRGMLININNIWIGMMVLLICRCRYRCLLNRRGNSIWWHLLELIFLDLSNLLLSLSFSFWGYSFSFFKMHYIFPCIFVPPLPFLALNTQWPSTFFLFFCSISFFITNTPDINTQ